MLRISRMSDYAVVVLSQMARKPEELRTARSLSEESGVPEPTVAKLLKALSRGGVLQAQRGAQGGYSLSRAAERISAADIIGAIDGPLALTSCVDGSTADSCGVESLCPLKGRWDAVNQAIVGVLEDVSLETLAAPPDFVDPPAPLGSPELVSAEAS